MELADDRLAGDLVWEMFPVPAQASTPARRLLLGLECAILIVLTWLLFPPLSVVLACVTFAARDFRDAWRLARTIPDKPGGGICSLFGYAWGACKVGMTAFVAMFVGVVISVMRSETDGPHMAIFTGATLWFGGFMSSSVLTGIGLVKAFRSAMRVWVGEGINRARALLTAMLIVGFTFVVLGPMCLLLVGDPLNPAKNGIIVPLAWLGLYGGMFGGPVVILIVLDWISRRVVADRPGKFGAKVTTVGKWN
jgi:hypothetical protein